MQFGEVEDGVDLGGHDASGHAHHGAGQVEVFVSGQLGIEADAEFEERNEEPGVAHPAAGGAIDSGDHLE